MQRRAKPFAEIGEDEGSGEDADGGGRDVGKQPDAEKGGGEVDQKEGKERREAEKQQVAEAVFAEPVTQPLQPRRRRSACRSC